MLKSIDILVGLSVVMLVASMAVTVMTGFVTHIRNSRGRNLQQGIADLLRLINPSFTSAVVNAIAGAVLTHPLIRDNKGRMGSVIHREELTKLLMELSAGNGPQQLEPAIQAQLQKTLAEHGIDNPAQTLDNIRALALQLEKSNPELSNMARSNLAILHEAESRFVAKINTWFDQTMDRVSERFTLSTRTITFICGLILALALQLDSIALVNRISVDDALRQSLVTQAQKISEQINSNAPQSRDLYSSVIDQGVVSVPKYPEDFSKLRDLRHLTGILFTTLLLSLGAPFWYGALKQLLQLRSKIAQDDDVQRKGRQSTQEVAITPAGPAAISPAQAQERGTAAAG
jgi:hypothetical protein